MVTISPADHNEIKLSEQNRFLLPFSIRISHRLTLVSTLVFDQTARLSPHRNSLKANDERSGNDKRARIDNPKSHKFKSSFKSTKSITDQQ